MPAAYALLDPLWSRAPLPVRGVARPVTLGPLRALEMYRAVFGRPLMKVYVYAVGDTLIDTGLQSLGGALVDWGRSLGARRAVVTHHHEDHTGGAARLQAEGFDVRGTPATSALLAADLPVPFYEHLAWGKATPTRLGAVGTTVELDGETAEVLPAPGHCVDQVSFWLPSRGWLFSGDAFLHEKVRLFRRDEDFAATMVTLDRLVALPIDALWCAHRPRPTGGRAALLAKREHLREMEGRIRDLAARGWPDGRIAAALQLRAGGLAVLSLGDASTRNLVASVLRGPRPRREVRAVTG